MNRRMARMATSSPLPTSSFHIPDPVHGCLTGMGSGLCSPAVSQSMAPQAPPALGSSCFRPDKQTMCWRVARGQDHPSPSNTGREHRRGATVSPSEPTARAL